VSKARKLPDAKYLWSVLHYDAGTGLFTWKFRPREMFKSERIFLSWNAKCAGKPAFNTLGMNGYLYGSIWGEKYLAHRIAFKMMTDIDPVGVDHEDGVPTHNAWGNLREADQSVNGKNSTRPSNNTSGVVGVYWYKSRRKWMALINVGGVSRSLGYFREKQDAIDARKTAEIEFGFHPNHGRPAHVQTT
jgi:hypothetical protein